MEKYPAGFEGGLITMAADLGRITGNPPDISALTYMPVLSRITIMRTAPMLEEVRLLRIKKKIKGQRLKCSQDDLFNGA